MQSDLRDSFEYFARGSTLICRSDFESIIHNFGFNLISQRDKEAELLKLDSEYYKRTGYEYGFLEKAVIARWCRGKGAEEEIKEAFKLFDRSDRVLIKPVDLRQVLNEHLDHPVTEQDIADIMAACDTHNTGSISYKDFQKFYSS